MPARLDSEAGRVFLESSTLFACVLLGPHPERETWLAYAAGDAASPVAQEKALELARGIGGRNHAILVERVALGSGAWPAGEPPHPTSYVVERGGFVVFAPSLDVRVSMPPAMPHLMLRLVAAGGSDGEAAARGALAELGTCGLVGRVRAVLLGDSGAEVDALVRGPGERLVPGWFPRK